jgi:hypothetical protein
MQHSTHTALFTTVSGVVGGVGKAITAKLLLLAITILSLSTVIIYAATSAAAGYAINKIMDIGSRKFNRVAAVRHYAYFSVFSFQVQLFPLLNFF